MVRVFTIFILLFTIYAFANEYENLSLKDALNIAKKQNLEINIADFETRVKELEIKVAKGYHYGKLDLTLQGARSNDAGNVFGFKLQSREASFGDFGFSEFLNSFGQSGVDLLSITPDDLNYPKSRNHFDTKLTYEVPLYTGKKLTYYKQIAKNMYKMSKLDSDKTKFEKFFQIKKAYYDISLLENFEKNLSKIEKNMHRLKKTISEMKKEGYAKKTDILEIDSRLSNVIRMINETKAYKELSYQFLSFLLNNDVKSIKTLDIDNSPKLPNKDDILKRSIDIQKVKLAKEITSNMLKIAKASYLPEVGAFLEYGSSDDKPFNNFTDHDRYTFGVGLKYNIFNGGIDAAKIEQSRVNLLKIDKQMELAKRGVELKVSKIKTEIKSFDFQIQALKKELELSNEIFNSYEARYKEGLASINDVVIKQSLLIEKLLKLKEIQNKKNEKVLQLIKMAQED